MSTSVRVILPLGEYTAPLCHVQEIRPGEVVVSCACPDVYGNYMVMAVFRRGEWLSATEYDHDGQRVNTLYSSELVWRLRLASAALEMREVA